MDRRKYNGGHSTAGRKTTKEKEKRIESQEERLKALERILSKE